MRIAVVGTGLIGSSLGLAWRAAGHTVSGCDNDARALEAALARGAFDRAVTLNEARGADALVLAVPLDVTCALLAQLRDDGQSNPAVMLDVASLQEPVLQAAAGLPGFVATHPMAGREGNGAAAADAAIFRDQSWIYEPGDGAAQATVLGLIAQTGAVPIPLPAALHDRAVALTSHVPQLLAIALAHCVRRHADEEGVRSVVGPGLAGALRLARARWTMWGPLIAAERARDAELLEELAAELGALANLLRQGELASARAAFEDAAPAVADIFRYAKGNQGGQDSR